METRYGKRKYGFVDMTGWVMAEHGVPNSWLTVLELAEPYISHQMDTRDNNGYVDVNVVGSL